MLCVRFFLPRSSPGDGLSPLGGGDGRGEIPPCGRRFERGAANGLHGRLQVKSVRDGRMFLLVVISSMVWGHGVHGKISAWESVRGSLKTEYRLFRKVNVSAEWPHPVGR